MDLAWVYLYFLAHIFLGHQTNVDKYAALNFFEEKPVNLLAVKLVGYILNYYILPCESFLLCYRRKVITKLPNLLNPSNSQKGKFT